MAAQEMRTYLRDVIGIPNVLIGPANARRVAVQEEGLESLEDLLEFDKDGIKTM